MKPLALGRKPLTLTDVWEVAHQRQRVVLSSQAEDRIREAQRFLNEKANQREVLYGVNTGFGLLSDVRIAPEQIEELQYNLLRSHAVGTGTHLEDEAVRAMLLLRANTLVQGHSGVSVGLVLQILKVLNSGICPLIPEQGSVGASGDLSPLAHLALVLIGEGQARLNGKTMTGAKALKAVGLRPIALGPKEGLALINGTQFMAALGVLNLLEAEYLCACADLVSAMTLEALRGTPTAFDAEIHQIRPHPGQIEVARRMRSFLGFPKRSEIANSHKDCGKVQDPYSLRCIPQVHGASRDALEFVRGVLEREINSVTDNPLVFPKSQKILSGGNFHGQILAIAMDLLAIACAELASISEQRLEKLVNPSISGLPAFLAPEGGVNSGFMIVQVAAASIVSENKSLCHPASVDSIPTSADKEDHVSMGAWAARKARMVLQNSRKVLAMECLAAAQGIDFLRPLQSTAVIEKLHKKVRAQVPSFRRDRTFYDAIAKVEDLIANRELAVH